MTTDVAEPVDAVAVAPAADPGFLQRYGTSIEYILIPGAALIAALGVFGLFVFLFGKNPDRKSTRLNSSHYSRSRMPSSA